MGRARGPRGLFEYRGQWIDQEEGRTGYYRYWYDGERRKTRRRALAAETLEGAIDELIDALGAAPASIMAPTQVELVRILAHYKDNYAAVRGSRQLAAARRASQLALFAMESLVELPTVADLTRLNQRRMWVWMAENHGLSAKSIMTYMIAVRAAVNYSATPQVIDVDGQQKEVRLLSESVPVFCNQTEIAEHIGGNVSVPREYIPTYEELGRWIDAIVEEDDFRYVILALNTCARNEAIFDLDIKKQVSWEFGTIDLNPVGRRQTKKRRPIIRMTTNLAAWLKHWGDNKPVRLYQDTVEKRINKIGKPPAKGEKRPDLGMPEMTCYTLRHFMATNMRRTSKPVSREQRSRWLGHTVSEGSRTTDWYEKFDPDYLEEPMRATEEIIKALQNHTRRSLFAPTMHPQGVLEVIEGGRK